MRLVLVTWLDAVREDDECTPEEAKDRRPSLVEDAGWLVTEDEQRIVLAMARIDGGESVRNTLVIPRGMVRGMDDLSSTLPGKGEA